MLEVRDLTKIYQAGDADRLLVLDAVSLSVARNQFVCLLGPSGCGKTTLLRIVVGLEQADAGAVLVEGAAVRGPGAERSMVFQSYGLLPWRSVRRNVELGLELRGAR